MGSRSASSSMGPIVDTDFFAPSSATARWRKSYYVLLRVSTFVVMIRRKSSCVSELRFIIFLSNRTRSDRSPVRRPGSYCKHKKSTLIVWLATVCSLIFAKRLGRVKRLFVYSAVTLFDTTNTSIDTAPRGGAGSGEFGSVSSACGGPRFDSLGVSLLLSRRNPASSNNIEASNVTRWLRSETRIWIGNKQA
jgi:hypothetical protein